MIRGAEGVPEGEPDSLINETPELHLHREAAFAGAQSDIDADDLDRIEDDLKTAIAECSAETPSSRDIEHLAHACSDLGLCLRSWCDRANPNGSGMTADRTTILDIALHTGAQMMAISESLRHRLESMNGDPTVNENVLSDLRLELPEVVKDLSRRLPGLDEIPEAWKRIQGVSPN